MLIEAEGVEIKSEDACAGKPAGSSCWMELENHPGCYVWNTQLSKEESATWSGRCSGGVARGVGTIVRTYTVERNFSETHKIKFKKQISETGKIKRGRFDGHWVVRDTRQGTRHEGPYVRGKRNGDWVNYRENGSVWKKGPYVEGKQHGDWVNYRGNGSVWERGPIVEGRMHGDWVSYHEDGRFEERGPFVHGQREGIWYVAHYRNGKLKVCYQKRYSQGSIIGKSKKAKKKMWR